jgi:hypothetical protein
MPATCPIRAPLLTRPNFKSTLQFEMAERRSVTSVITTQAHAAFHQNNDLTLPARHFGSPIKVTTGNVQGGLETNRTIA